MKVLIPAYGNYDLTNIDARFQDSNLNLSEFSSKKNKKFGIALNSHVVSLLKNAERGKNFKNFETQEVVESQSSQSETWDYEGVMGVGQYFGIDQIGYSENPEQPFGEMTPDTFPKSSALGIAACFYSVDAELGPYVVSTGNVNTIQIDELVLVDGIYLSDTDATFFLVDENPFGTPGALVNIKVRLN
ncbi:MAG: hypothetical protein WC466_08440 [Candidatus Izemoplasmatales bacterium]